MTSSNLLPWASGPAEILKHGLDLLRQDSDSSRRLAIISIDNAVELMIKIYLGLPRRVNGLKITRAEYQEFAESFPKLLDALEKHAAVKLGLLNLGEIEWYHRLRNQLYHQGNGLTVEKGKVEAYGQLAAALFENLFDAKPLPAVDDDYLLLADFIYAWSVFARAANELSSFYYFDENGDLRTTLNYANELRLNKYLLNSEYEEVKGLWIVRNEIVNENMYFHELLTSDMVNRLKQITRSVQDRIESR
jgi:hypothetical protein